MKNNLKKILEKRGFRKVQLTDECLKKTGVITPHRLNKILDNEADLTATEINGLTGWFGIAITDLIPFSAQAKSPVHEQTGN